MTRDGAAHVQQRTAVRREELRPGVLALGCGTRVLQASERELESCRTRWVVRGKLPLGVRLAYARRPIDARVAGWACWNLLRGGSAARSLPPTRAAAA